MEFLDEINNQLNFYSEHDLQNYKAYLIGGKGLCIFGAREIYSFSNEKIIIKTKNNKLEIIGSELFVKEYCVGEIYIKGIIKKIEVI